MKKNRFVAVFLALLSICTLVPIQAQNPTLPDANRGTSTINGRLGIITNGATAGYNLYWTGSNFSYQANGGGGGSGGGDIFSASNNVFRGSINTFSNNVNYTGAVTNSGSWVFPSGAASGNLWSSGSGGLGSWIVPFWAPTNAAVTWTFPQIFSSSVTHSGAVTNSGTSATTGPATLTSSVTFSGAVTNSGSWVYGTGAAAGNYWTSSATGVGSWAVPFWAPTNSALTWTFPQTFSSSVTHSGAVTNSGTLVTTGPATFSSSITQSGAVTNSGSWVFATGAGTGKVWTDAGGTGLGSWQTASSGGAATNVANTWVSNQTFATLLTGAAANFSGVFTNTGAVVQGSTLTTQGAATFTNAVTVNGALSVSNLMAIAGNSNVVDANRTSAGNVLGFGLFGGNRGTIYVDSVPGEVLIGSISSTKIGILINNNMVQTMWNVNGNVNIAHNDSGTSTATNSQVTIRNAMGAANRVLNLVGASSQSGDLINAMNSSSVTQFKVTSSGGMAVGATGSTVTNIAQAVATLDFPSINGLASADLSVAVTGCSTNDIVSLGKPATETAGLITVGLVASNGFVTVRATNITAAPIDQAAMAYRVETRSY